MILWKTWSHCFDLHVTYVDFLLAHRLRQTTADASERGPRTDTLITVE